MIYLDNCATTKPRPSVIKEMVRAMEVDFFNPSGLHRGGFLVEEEIKKIRILLSQFLKVLPEEVIFTSGGTESNNFVIKGILERDRNKGKNLVATGIDHSSVYELLKLGKDLGFEVRKLPVDRMGRVSIDKIKEAVDENTSLVVMTQVHNELGTIQPINEIGEYLKRNHRKVHFHVDGVQAFGKVKLPNLSSFVDSFSFSGHKIYGPKGIGGLYLRKTVHLSPLISGGGQEGNRRSGTENVPGIFGFGAAIRDHMAFGKEEGEKVLSLYRLLREKIIEKFDDVVINSPEDGSPYILSISFPNLRSEVVLHMLEEEEIYISTASACSSHSRGTKNRILEEIGLSDDLAAGTLRICLSKDLEESDILTFVEELKLKVSEVQSIIGRK